MKKRETLKEMVQRIIEEENIKINEAHFNIIEIMKKFDFWFKRQSPKNQKHEEELIDKWLETYYKDVPNSIKEKIIQQISDKYNIELYRK